MELLLLNAESEMVQHQPMHACCFLPCRDAEEMGSNRIEVEGEVVYGVSPVLAAFAAQRRSLFTLFVQEGER